MMADSLRPPPSPSSSNSISIAASSRPDKGQKDERAKMKTTVKGKYEVNNSAAAAAAATTISFHAGDGRLKASATEATFANGSSLDGLVLSFEKPGAFILDYTVKDKDVRFQFMNSFKVVEKTVNLTYTHARAANRTTIDGSLVFDPANKVSVNYAFGSGNCKVKYWYAHGELKRTVLEPCYDVSKNAWDFAMIKKFEGGDSLKATYHTTTKNLGLEWNRDSQEKGCFKRLQILASMNLADKQMTPKLMMESTWHYEI
ncbi:outer envelope pore protein 24, chloroplastic-like isoform X1 [Zingiber officinale]|uniref:outer envelope pore protein 24, chloroplastic-like isoform X1 n=1 Tax=Zingiber officinale TaxID=94328 RepID=UPI001C4B95B6|nr:outer envelope pore protein 24, chloroplastic-like isoform X1 [Zingiber officinale]